MDIRTIPVDQLRLRGSDKEIVAIYDQENEPEESNCKCFVVIKDCNGEHDTTTCTIGGSYTGSDNWDSEDVVLKHKTETDIEQKFKTLEARIAALETKVNNA